jgi:thymidylate synthase
VATLISESTGSRLYLTTLTHILKHHRLRSPRELTTLDAGYVVLELGDPTHGLPVHTGRGLNLNIAAAEAVQLIGGFARPDMLTRASVNFQRYVEEDGRFHGAYGSRVTHQVSCAVNKLKRDPSSRQAVVTLWDPWLDNQPGKKDYPCTVFLQFEVSPYDGRLEMNTVMRSNDAWLGLPYDLFQFTQLQLSVAHALGLPAGRYRHTALSMHIYIADEAKAYKVVEQGLTHPEVEFYLPRGFGRSGVDCFQDVMRRARRTTTTGVNEEETIDERWYRDRFASYLGPDVDGGGADDRAPEPVQS